MASLRIHGEGKALDAYGLELVVHDGEIRVDLPTGSEVGVGRLSPGRDAGLDRGGPRLCVLEPTLSRRHFTLFEHDHRWCVRDELSSGGTFINRGLVRVLQSGAPHVLADGDIIHLGAPTFAPWAIFRSE